MGEVRNAVSHTRRWARRHRHRIGARGVILAYHRVSEQPSDPLLLCVHPNRFRQHLEILARYGNVLPVDDLVRAPETSPHRRPPLAVTFDDGYADNLTEAAPLLSSHGIPATVHVTSGMVGTTEEFWWDDLERIIFQTASLPPSLDLALDTGAFRFELGGFAEYAEDSRRAGSGWNVTSRNDPTPRHTLYRSLADLMRPLPTPARSDVLTQLRSWSGVGEEGRETHRALSSAQLVALAGFDGVAIGAHSETHPALSQIPGEDARQEIVDSKAHLERAIGRPVDQFAYPFGDPGSVDAETARIVAAAGFSSACTMTQAPIQRSDDLFLLPRLLVRDWDAAAFERYLRERVLW